MNYAYIRVSTDMQNYEGQRFEIENWCRGRNVSIDRWINETVSGSQDSRRRQLGKALRKMKKGDLLVCTELSRLGRNMMMVMGILNQCSQQGIQVYSIKDRFELSDNLNSKIIAFAFALAAEIERNLISRGAGGQEESRRPPGKAGREFEKAGRIRKNGRDSQAAAGERRPDFRPCETTRSPSEHPCPLLEGNLSGSGKTIIIK